MSFAEPICGDTEMWKKIMLTGFLSKKMEKSVTTTASFDIKTINLVIVTALLFQTSNICESASMLWFKIYCNIEISWGPKSLGNVCIIVQRSLCHKFLNFVFYCQSL